MNTPVFIAEESAKMLLEVEAISIRPNEPFTFTSGRLSPVYVDCRKLISFPRVRRRLMDFAQQVIETNIGYESIDVVAGGETAGIPYAAWVADRLMQPMLYVRKKAKGFGKNARIEGYFTEGQRALLVEDLATDGGSKVNFVNAMREAGLKVEHAFVVFFYHSYPTALADLQKENINLHWLTTWKDVLTVCRQHKKLSDADIKSVEDFLADPEGWDKAHR